MGAQLGGRRGDLPPGLAHVELARAADLLVGITQHLAPLRNPAHGTSHGEDGREHAGGNAHGALDDARVEVHVRVKLAGDEVIVFQCDLLELACQLEERIVLQAQLGQHLGTGFLHQLGARVVVLVDAVTEAHQLDAGFLVLHLLDELADLVDTALGQQVFQHAKCGFVGATVCRAPQRGDTGSDAGERVGTRRTGQTHRGGGGVLLVVGVQDEDAVQRTHQHLVGHVLVAGRREHQVHEVGGVAELVARIGEGLTVGVFVGQGNQRRHLGDETDGGHVAVLFLGDVERVVVEGRQCAHAGHQHRHRVRVTTEAAEEADHLLVQHGMVRDDIVEIGLLLGRGQLALQQQVADIQVVAVLGQILDGIAAIQQLTLVAVNEGDGGFAGPGGHEAGVEGELAGVGVQLADVNDIRPHGSLVDRELSAGGTIRERQRCGVGRFGGCHCLPSKVISGQGPDHEGSRRTARRRWRLPAFAPSPNLSP